MTRCLIIAGMLLTIFSGSVYSQWKSKVTLGSSLYSGNVDEFNFRTELGVSHIDSSFEYSGFAKILYAESNHKQTNEEYKAGLKFDYRPYNTISPFLSAEIYRNKFKNYHWLFSGYGGAKYYFYNTKDAQYSISAALMYEREEYFDAIATDENDTISSKDKMRLSIRPKIEQKISDFAVVKHVTFFKITPAQTDDYDISSTTAIESKLSKKISLEVSYEINYKNKPAGENVEKTDQAIIATLVLKL